MWSVWHWQYLHVNTFGGVSCWQFFCVLVRFLSFATGKKCCSMVEIHYQLVVHVLVKIFGILPIQILCQCSVSCVVLVFFPLLILMSGRPILRLKVCWKGVISERDDRSVIQSDMSGNTISEREKKKKKEMVSYRGMKIRRKLYWPFKWGVKIIIYVFEAGCR